MVCRTESSQTWTKVFIYAINALSLLQTPIMYMMTQRCSSEQFRTGVPILALPYLFPFGAHPLEIKRHLLLVELLLGCTFAASRSQIFVDEFVVVAVPRFFFLSACKSWYDKGR